MAKKQKTQSAEPAKVKKVTKVESVLTSTDVSELHRLRDLARKDKNWAVADALRDRIASLGHRVQDEKISNGATSKLIKVKAGSSSEDEESGDDDDEDDEVEGELEDDDEAPSEESSDDEEGEEEEEKAKDVPPSKGERTLSMGVKVLDVKVGKGPVVELRRPVYMAYVGRLTTPTGKVFDKSAAGRPFKFKLGVGEVIKGWDIGVVGMRRGGVRRITCPPKAAYGDKGAGSAVPPRATLVFDVTLVG